jgi:hypothetical protein
MGGVMKGARKMAAASRETQLPFDASMSLHIVSDAGQATSRCEICERSGLPLTRHHLIPRSQHQKRYARERFTREELLTRVTWLCAPCHKYLHSVFEERELGGTLNSLERLRDHPEVQRFAAWLGAKPAGFLPRVYTMKRPRMETG